MQSKMPVTILILVSPSSTSFLQRVSVGPVFLRFVGRVVIAREYRLMLMTQGVVVCFSSFVLFLSADDRKRPKGVSTSAAAPATGHRER
ncbi:hypothetical protein F5Y07DRAFT_361948 [Xylaria sp. FL0933]|nr:hypothetical protein F5Y07DRAFT_361948 [Xylaria sp. FL0933]